MPPLQVVDPTQALRRRQRQSELFGGLAFGRGGHADIRHLPPTAGQRHVPRPGVALAPGTLDEQHLRFPGRRSQYERDAGLASTLGRQQAGTIRGERGAACVKIDHAVSI